MAGYDYGLATSSALLQASVTFNHYSIGTLYDSAIPSPCP